MWLIPMIFTPYTWLLAAAILPAVALLVYVYKQDRLDKEPAGLLLLLVGLGMVATVAAGFLESIGMSVLGGLVPEGTKTYYAWLFFAIVGVAEEGLKYLVMRGATWKHRAFNCQFDGIVYAVFVSLGFALAENVSYVLSYGLATALVRAVTSIPGHACFGVFMGVFYGMAKRYETYGCWSQCRRCRWLAFLVPVLIHGAYDYLAAGMSGSGGSTAFLIFIALLFIVSFRMVKRLSNADNYIR